MGQPRPLFCLFSVFFKQTLQFLQYVKNVHPVYGAGIRTHNLQNVSLFPLPLDQGSRPMKKNCLIQNTQNRLQAMNALIEKEAEVGA